MDQRELFKTCRQLHKQGRDSEGLRLLRDALRRGRLNSEGVEWAGRMIQAQWLLRPPDDVAARVLLLGQFTTSWLVPALTAAAWAQGVPLLVSEGGYDNVFQDLLALSPLE